VGGADECEQRDDEGERASGHARMWRELPVWASWESLGRGRVGRLRG
jgi:hypothetical protein